MPRFLALSRVSIAFCVLVLGTVLAARGTEAQKVAKKSGTSATPTARVAVLYFDYAGSDEDMAFLRKGLAQMLVTDLSEVSGLTLIERSNLEAVLAELELGKTQKIDRRTANKIGKLLGARYLVTGGYFTFRGQLRVDAKVIDVERGTTKSVGVTKSEADFMGLEMALAGKLADKLAEVHAATSTASAPRKRAHRPRKPGLAKTAKVEPTEKVSIKVAARYGRALDAADKGRPKLAIKELAALEKEAPSFKPKADELRILLR